MLETPERQQKIAIIGAGPAGVHLAHLLVERGFNHITLFEKNNRIGGKSYSIEADGIPHEMGTCYLTLAYQKLLDLIKHHQLSAITKVRTEQRKCILEDNMTQVMATDWLIHEIAKQSLLTYLPFLPKRLAGIKLLQAIKKYNQIYPDFYNASDYDIPQNAKKERAEILSQSMHQFLKTRSLLALEPPFLFLYTLMCYGRPDTSPAYYGMYWMSELFLRTYTDYITKKSNPLLIGMLHEGYQEIWKKLAKISQLNVHYNATVKKIQRDVLNKEGKLKAVRIHYEENAIKKQEDFDFLINAIPAKLTLDMLESPTENEKRILGSQIFSTVVTRCVKVNNPQKENTLIYWMHHLLEKNTHKIYAYRNAAPILANVEKNEQYLVTYQCHEDAEYYDQQLSEKYFIQNLEEQGIKIQEMIATEVWYYFPRFSASGIRDGLPWEILSEQGKNHTWYVGSSVSFESINAVLNFNHYMVDHYL